MEHFTKDRKILNISMLMTWIFVQHGHANTEEICNAEIFEATCAADEVIVMESAVYGRMRLGRCVDKDYGHLGCSNDALASFDAACSAKQSCDVTISDKLRKDVSGACGAFVVGYAEVVYDCRQAYRVTRELCQRGEILLTTEHTLVATSAIDAECYSAGRLRLSVNPGQTMNISLWHFGADNQRRYGVLSDPVSSNTAELTGALRHQHILTSVGNVIEVNLNRGHMDDTNFLIDVTVIGCADMSPPDGAWMSRHGDVIEVGCHAGSKSWSLQCESNHWVGVLGYCGPHEKTKVRSHVVESGESGSSVSLNVVVFGVSSLVILVSACVFLAGVIILKRKLTSKHENGMEKRMPSLPNAGYQTNPHGSLSLANEGCRTLEPWERKAPSATLLKSGQYKSLEMPLSGTDCSRVLTGTEVQRHMVPNHTQYINSTASDQSGESLKYFVLEDCTKNQVNI